MINYTDDLGKAVLKHVEQLLAEKSKLIVEEEAANAAARAAARVREMSVEICTRMREKMDVSFYNARELHIKLTLE